MLADLLPLISLMVAGLGTLVAILVLAAPSKNRLAAYVLAVFILVQSLANLYQYFLSDHSAISQQLSFYLQLSVLLAYFITGPLLYAYTRLMTSAGFVLRAIVYESSFRLILLLGEVPSLYKIYRYPATGLSGVPCINGPSTQIRLPSGEAQAPQIPTPHLVR